MALPPIDTDQDLEAEDTEAPLEDDAEGEMPAEAPDPMFAADIEMAFPDLEDDQIMALQRAMLGLMSSMGGGGMGGPPPAPAAPPMGF